VSADAKPPLRTVAFGDLANGVWGVAWGDTEPVLAIGAPQLPEAPARSLADIGGFAADERWIVRSEGLELTVSPDSDAATSAAIAGFDQLCRVHGRAVIDGAEHELDLPGRRGSRPELDLARLDSVRDVAAWFGSGDGLALTSLRPRGAKGQDRDVVSAGVFEHGAAIAVSDPRLSTTYTADGHPIRVGLELWLDAEESDEQYPRRAAGERTGGSVALQRAGLELEAYALRCRSRGEEGVGVYVLARAR
jgi:hypothetical protein